MLSKNNRKIKNKILIPNYHLITNSSFIFNCLISLIRELYNVTEKREGP